jgi:hypothetical protein
MDRDAAHTAMPSDALVVFGVTGDLASARDLNRTALTALAEDLQTMSQEAQAMVDLAIGWK